MKKESKKTQQERRDITYGSIIVGLFGMVCGIIIGMIAQQVLFMESAIEVAEALEGTTFNIEIDINETLIVDRTMDRFEDIKWELNNTETDVFQENKK